MIARLLVAAGLVLFGGASAAVVATSATGATPRVAAAATLKGGTAADAVRARAAAAPAAGAVPGLSDANALSVQWALPSSPAAVGARVSATVQFATAVTMRHASIALTTTGPVAVVSARTVTLGSVRSYDAARITVTFVVTSAGSGGVTARLAGSAPGAGTLRYVAALNYATGDGHVAFSADGLLQAQAAALALERPSLGARSYGQRLAGLLGSGATERYSSPAVHAASAHAASKTTTVSGAIDYTASDFSTHPSRTIEVQIRDLDGTSPTGTLVASTMTNGNGDYSATVSTLRPNGRPRVLYVSALAASTGFVIYPVGANQAAQHINSAAHTATGAPMTIDLTANNTADNNTAFDVADMLVSGDQYVLRINNNRPFARVTVTFPNPKGTNFTPSTNTAKILHGDEFDWDVVLHEFGHYVADNLHIDTSKGGLHDWADNLGQIYGKSAGIQLAWSEGFATWFALTAEEVLNIKALHIPNAGDSYFDDTDDANFHVPMDTNTPYPSLGEDNELSVARTLWHIREDSDLGMTDLQMIKALVAARATTLSAAIAALMPADHAALFDDTQTVSAPAEYQSNFFACLLTNQEVAPEITSPANGSVMPSTPQTYTWTPYGAGPSNRLDSFTVQYWSSTWGKLIFESPAITATTYTPTAAAWNTITETTDESGQYPGALHVVVKGTGTNAPVTGPYKSCAITESVGPTLFVSPVDTTDGIIASQPPSCPDYFNPAIDEFYLSGSGLQPNTSYSLELFDPNNGYGAVTNLSPTSVTSDANGDITQAVITIPVMPAETSWPLIAAPATGRTATTTVTVNWTTCATWNQDASSFTFQWGGAGVEPNTTVSVYWNGVLEDSTTAYPNGSYGSSVNMTCPQASNTITVDATTFNGPSELSGGGQMCAFSGPIASGRASPPRLERYALVGGPKP